MTLFKNTPPLTDEAKLQGIHNLLAQARHDADYYVLLVGAVLIALGAIFTDSIPLLIASMIVAPLAYPILLLGLGLAAMKSRLIMHALGLLGVSCATALVLAFGLTWLFGSERTPDAYISFAANHHVAVAIAVVSGAIATFGIIRPKIAPAITGVAIAVSLMPPLVATGVSLVPGGKALDGAFILFLLNVAGISFSSALVFALSGIGKLYRVHFANK